jgi:hypothetical protein
MTALRVADFYERTLYEGEPIRQAAAPTRLDRSVVTPLFRVGQDLLWMLGDWLVRVPAPVIRPAPDVQRMTQELRSWTRWSARQVADVLSTSHTTVLAIENGRPLAAGHSGDLRRHIVDAHTVVSRIFILADRDPRRTAHALDAAPGHGLSACTLLEHGEPAKAYVAALDVLRPPTQGLLVGSHPAEPGLATAPLHD